LINGVIINSPSLGTASVGGIPLNNIDRIEVVKGAGSLLYGSNAMGGIVNIITKDPKRNKTDLKADAGLGTQNRYQVSAEHGMFAFGDLGYYVTATHRAADGFRDNSDLTHNDASMKLVWDKGNPLYISLYGDYIQRESGQPGPKPPEGTSDYYVSGVKIFNSESANLLSRGEEKDAHLVLDIKSKPMESIGINLKGFYNDMESFTDSRYSSGTGNKAYVVNEVKGAEANVTISPFAGFHLLVGGDYKNYTWTNRGVDTDIFGTEQPSTHKYTTNSLDTRSAFTELQYRPIKYVKLLAGVRHESHSEFGTENIPRYGVIINPTDKTALKLSHGKHFNAPTPNDLFWPYEDWGWGMGAQGNPNLKPETGWHSDVTLEQIFPKQKVFFTVSYFNWDLEDSIRWIPDASLFYRPQNLGTYKASGWEVGTKIGPFYNAILSLNYTSTNAEEEIQEGFARDSLYVPQGTFKGNLVYYTDFGLTGTTIVRYVGTRPAHYANSTATLPDYTLDSYWTVDLKLDQRLWDHWIFSLQGNNLFDKDYGTYVTGFYNPTTFTSTLSEYPGAGLSVFFSVACEY